MENALDWVKTHPLYVAGGVGLLLVMYVLYSSGSSSGGGVAAPSGPSDAAVQSAAAVQIAQTQAGAASNQLSAGLAAQENNNATAVTIAGISAQVAHYQTEQQANVQEVGIAAQRDVSLAGLQTQQLISLANDATEQQISMLNNQTTQVSYQEQTKQLLGVENANVEIAKAYSSTQLGIAQSHDENTGGLFGGGGFLGLGI